MRRSVSVHDRYYWDITPAQRGELHSWIDTFGDHKCTAKVTVIGEGMIEAEEIDLAASHDAAVLIYRIRRYLTTDPPPWMHWDPLL